MTLDRFAAFAARLSSAGLDLVGCALAAHCGTLCRQPALLPDGGSVILVGSGGTRHWEGLDARQRAHPDPIDRAAATAIDTAVELLGDGTRRLPAAAQNAFDLRSLGALTGIGVVSPYLEMLIHPRYGPWIGIRAVLVSDSPWPATPALASFDPCGPCTRPCLEACPVDAYRHGAPWSFAGCAAHRRAGRAPETHCDDGCHSRLACVVGPEHAYGALEYRHRHRANLAHL